MMSLRRDVELLRRWSRALLSHCVCAWVVRVPGFVLARARPARPQPVGDLVVEVGPEQGHDDETEDDGRRDDPELQGASPRAHDRRDGGHEHAGQPAHGTPGALPPICRTCRDSVGDGDGPGAWWRRSASPTWSGRSRPVAHAAHGDDDLGPLGVLLDLGAQPLDVDVDEAGVTGVAVAPHLLEQHLAGEDLPRLARERDEEVELERGQAERLARRA